MNRLMKLRNKHSLETRLEPIQQIFTPPLKIVKFLNRIWDFHKNDLGQLKKNGIPVKNGEISCLNICSFSDCRGRSCIVSHVNPGRQGTLAFNSFRSQVAFYKYI